jgi:mannose/fructose/N-acetylgalactosamine-specific phosphotransferase system component IIB
MARLDARLDDRLLHSEVIYACLPAFGSRRVVVATTLPQRGGVDPAALPAEVTCAVVDPVDSVRAVGSPDAPEVPTLVVFGTAADASAALAAGLAPERICLGNRARRAATAPLAPTYFVDDHELRLLRDLAAAGTELVAQRVPSEPARPVVLGDGGLAPE